MDSTIDLRFPWKKALPLIFGIIVIITPVFATARKIDLFGEDIWFIPIVFTVLAAILIPVFLFMNKKYNSFISEDGQFLKVGERVIPASAVHDVELWGDSSGITAVLKSHTENGPLETRIVITNRVFPLRSRGLGALGRLVELATIPVTAPRPPYAKLGANRIPVGKTELMPFLHEQWNIMQSKGK